MKMNRREIADKARANAGRTAITRKALSAPVRLLRDRGVLTGRVLDFGCGKGRDADELGFEKYDPNHFPEKPKGLFDTVICIYVLNVLSPDDRDQILSDIRSYLSPDGVAYIAVRRDIQNQGFRKGGTYQWNASLSPSEHGAITIANVRGKFRIYKVDKLPCRH